MVTQNPALKRTLLAITPPLMLALFSALLQAFDCTDLLRYQRDFIRAGQVWRLISGHFVHLGWSHWFMNMAGLTLIWLLFEPFLSAGRTLSQLLLSSLLISVCLYAFSPGVFWYVGLSGALHSLFLLGLFYQFRQQPRFSGLVLLFLLAKLGWEQLYGPLPGSEQTAGGNVVVVAHVYGAIIGAVLFGLESLLGGFNKISSG